MSESTLISSGSKLTREELALVPTPMGTNTHKPIPHAEVITALDHREVPEISPTPSTPAWKTSQNAGEVTDHGELARLGQVSPARICQYMTLLHLAPAIQEYLLFLVVSQVSPLSEVALRRIAREPRWDRQRALLDSLADRK